MYRQSEQEKQDSGSALGLWASRMAGITLAQSEAYGALARELCTAHQWSPVRELSLYDRRGRQALLLAAVKLRADGRRPGLVPVADWLRLARHFGYDARGTAGFFRRSADGSPGLLIREGANVKLAPAGLARILEYQGMVDAWSAEIQATLDV